MLKSKLMDKEIRTRIAPSPTGLAHVGNVYVALFNFAFARQNKGKFVLRIEDTDMKRHVPEAEKVIFDALNWLGLKTNESSSVGGDFGPYRQSERLDLYHQQAAKMLKEGLVYEKEGALWFKVPEGQTSWKDLIRGEIQFDNHQIQDFVVLKSDKYPSYNFAVTFDDWSMKISHVIRAEEHISNTPRQIMIYQALGGEIPKFAHLPLLRNTDHSKISKRKNPVAISWYQEEGYLPEALVNFLCLLGWSHPEGKDIFPIEEFIKHFSFDRISKSAPVFDLKKLDWLNGVYIRQKTNEDLKELIRPYLNKDINDINDDLIDKTLPLVKERVTKLSEFKDLIDFFIEEPKVEVKLILEKGGKDKDLIKKQLGEILNKLEKVEWEKTDLENLFRKFVEEYDYHLGKFFMAVRVVLTGKTATPPLFETMEVLGKEKTLRRIKKAITLLS